MAHGHSKRPARRYLLESPLRRPRLVLVPALVLALGGAAVGALLPPRYRAAALVEGEWHDPAEALLRRRGVDVAARRAQQVRERATQLGLLQSAAPGEDPLRLAADLRVRPMSPDVFVIEFTHSHAATAALVPNRIAAALEGLEGPRFKLARAAATPETSESPGPAAFAPFGALLGLALGLGAALVAELRDATVKGPEGLEDALALPLLAVIPEVRKGTSERGSRAARASPAARR